MRTKIVKYYVGSYAYYKTKDIIRTKGGKNNTILVDEIDIVKLRKFQIKEYTLQAYDKSFKPTPLGFKLEIILKKIKGDSII